MDSTKTIFKTKRIESIMYVSKQHAALKYPSIRQLTIPNDYVNTGEFDSKLYGKDFFNSKIQIARSNVNINILGIYRKNNPIPSSFGVLYQQTPWTEMQSVYKTFPINEISMDKTTLDFGF